MAQTGTDHGGSSPASERIVGAAAGARRESVPVGHRGAGRRLRGLRSRERRSEHRLVDVAPAPLLPGCTERTTGWPVAWKWAVAWRFGLESQQPTWPQVMHRRRCTQPSPAARHSSQPAALGRTGVHLVEVPARRRIVRPQLDRRLGVEESAPGQAVGRPPAFVSHHRLLPFGSSTSCRPPLHPLVRALPPPPAAGTARRRRRRSPAAPSAPARRPRRAAASGSGSASSTPSRRSAASSTPCSSRRRRRSSPQAQGEGRHAGAQRDGTAVEAVGAEVALPVLDHRRRIELWPRGAQQGVAGAARHRLVLGDLARRHPVAHQHVVEQGDDRLEILGDHAVDAGLGQRRPPRPASGCARRCAGWGSSAARRRRCGAPSPGRRRRSPASWRARCRRARGSVAGWRRRVAPRSPPPPPRRRRPGSAW